MAELAYLGLLQSIGLLLSATVIPFAALILGLKVFREKKRTGNLNYVRFIIFGVFTCFATMAILEYIVYLDVLPFLNAIFWNAITEVNLYSILIGSMVSLGLVLISYANRWEFLYYTPFFIFVGMIAFYFATGFDAWLELYIQIAAVVVLVFMFFTSFRVKDNGALGLAIFFTLVVTTLLIETTLINNIVIITYNAFILVFVFGYFKVFKTEVVK